MIKLREAVVLVLCAAFCAFTIIQQFQLEEKNKKIVKNGISIHGLHVEIYKRDSLIKVLQTVHTPERKRGTHKNLKYRIYALDKYKTVTPNELSEILMEIVVEIEKLEKP
jgi:hypothetical protein